MYISKTTIMYSAKCDYCGIELPYTHNDDLVSFNAHTAGWEWRKGYEPETFHACKDCKMRGEHKDRKVAALVPPQ